MASRSIRGFQTPLPVELSVPAASYEEPLTELKNSLDRKGWGAGLNSRHSVKITALDSSEELR